MSVHRQTYLDKITRWSGRGDFNWAQQCGDCRVRGNATPSPAQFRCHECFQPDLTCQVCCLKRHRMHPFHRIEVSTTILELNHLPNPRNLNVEMGRRSIRQDNLEVYRAQVAAQPLQHGLRKSCTLSRQHARIAYEWDSRGRHSVLWLHTHHTPAPPASSTPLIPSLTNCNEDMCHFRTDAPTTYAFLHHQGFNI